MSASSHFNFDGDSVVHVADAGHETTQDDRFTHSICLNSPQKVTPQDTLGSFTTPRHLSTHARTLL